MSSSLTVPACGEGTSMDAFSVSRVIRLCSCSTVSPTLTSTSMTSTSWASPISGTLITVTSVWADDVDAVSEAGATDSGAVGTSSASAAYFDGTVSNIN